MSTRHMIPVIGHTRRHLGHACSVTPRLASVADLRDAGSLRVADSAVQPGCRAARMRLHSAEVSLLSSGLEASERTNPIAPAGDARPRVRPVDGGVKPSSISFTPHLSVTAASPDRGRTRRRVSSPSRDPGRCEVPSQATWMVASRARTRPFVPPVWPASRTGLEPSAESARRLPGRHPLQLTPMANRAGRA